MNASVKLRGLCAVLCAACCGPSVQSFVARPNVICAGSAVQLSWQASTNGVLSAKAPPSALGNVPASGTREVSPHSTTTYRLDVHNFWGSDAREVDVDVKAGSGKKPVGQSVADPATTCSSATLTVVDELKPTSWGSDLTVAGVELPENVNRIIKVQHGDRETELRPTMRSSDRLAGLSVIGTWTLSTPLDQSETCGTPTIPRSLTILVILECKP